MHKFLTISVLLLISATCFGQTSSIYYYKETSRPAEEIKSEYPYDIAIRDANSDTLNTATVFKNGKPTILLFWLTTCAPCRAEMGAISNKYELWEKEADFNLYAISVDWPKNAEQFISRVEKSHWPFPAYHDFNREFGKIMPGALNGLPQLFVLDKKGNIVHHKRKYRPGDEEVLISWIKELQ